MAVDKKISELTLASSVSGSDLLPLAQGSNTNKFPLSDLITFLSTNLNSGATVTFGTVMPINSIGKDGDVFFFTDSFKIAQRVSGTWAIKFTLTSATSQSLIYGSGNPDNANGNNGDTYIDTLTGKFYKKESGVWNQKYSVASSATITTLPIIYGSGAPSNLTGVDTQSYIDIVTNKYYLKVSGAWALKFTVPIGTNGKTILNGTSDPSNVLATDGDFFYNTATKYFFGPKVSGVWPAGFSISQAPLLITKSGSNVDGNGEIDLSAETIPTYPNAPTIYIDDLTGGYQITYNNTTKKISGLYGVGSGSVIKIKF